MKRLEHAASHAIGMPAKLLPYQQIAREAVRTRNAPIPVSDGSKHI
jgi:hypothetical protein